MSVVSEPGKGGGGTKRGSMDEERFSPCRTYFFCKSDGLAAMALDAAVSTPPKKPAVVKRASRLL